MAIPVLCRRIGRILLDITIVTLIIVFIPWIPPNMKFESFSLTPARELQGKLERNYKLDKAEAIKIDTEITGPESMAIRGDEIYTGLIGGNVVKIVNGKLKPIARFGQHCEGKWEESKCGRPLGLRFDASGKLIVVDAYYGLFRVDVDTGTTETLVSSSDMIEGRRPLILNDLDISKDGTIYFSDSSTNVYLQDSIVEFLGEPSGRLLKYNIHTKKTTVLAKGLHFANGIQLSKNEDYVMISETCKSRVLRYYLKGEKQGQIDVLVDGLPGSPDNIRPNGRGGAYISLIAPRYSNRLSVMDVLGPIPLARKFVLRVMGMVHMLLSSIQSVASNEYVAKAQYYIGHLEPVAAILPRHAMIIEIDENGEIIGTLHAVSGQVSHISQITVDDKQKFAYLGSPYNTKIWKVKVDDLNACPRQKTVEINVSEAKSDKPTTGDNQEL